VRLDPALTRRLYGRAQAERWAVSLDDFAAALSASAGRAFGETPSATELEQYLSRLHLDDLALACACVAGRNDAWDYFVREYRPLLHRAADALDSSGGAREIADGLYGELFGARGAGSERRALLRYFHGRSSLATWLRAVLAQRFVDRVRTARRDAALPEDDSANALPSPAPPADPQRERYVAMMQTALAGALAALDARDRLRLGCYYAQELTLAETGRVLHEHEATVSRQLARTRLMIKAAVERHLRDAFGLTAAAIDECLESTAGDAGPLDLRQLIGPIRVAEVADIRKKSAATRSKKEQQV
jgi:RNA polymerase sigma-70 factor